MATGIGIGRGMATGISIGRGMATENVKIPP